MADATGYVWYSGGDPLVITGPTDSSPSTWTNYPSSGSDFTIQADASAMTVQYTTVTAPSSSLYLYALGYWTQAATVRYSAIAVVKWEGNNEAGPADTGTGLFGQVYTFPAGLYDGIEIYTQSVASSFVVKVEPFFGIEA